MIDTYCIDYDDYLADDNDDDEKDDDNDYAMFSSNRCKRPLKL